jgi:hypothetical protein
MSNIEKRILLREIESGSAYGFFFYYDDLRAMFCYWAKRFYGEAWEPLEYSLELYEAFLYAKDKYKPSKYTFNDFLMTAVRWRIMHINRGKQSDFERNIEISDNCVDFLGSYEDSFFSKLVVEGIKNELNGIDAVILQMVMDKYTYTEIGEYFGFTRQNVTYRLVRLRTKIIPILKRHGII